MHAAVVTEFDHSPRYLEFAEPVAGGPHDEIVDVVAAGLHPRVRSQAAGSHYTSTEQLPLVPGIDGVGRRADGSLVYFVLPDTAFGSMAERTAIDSRRAIPLPADADPVALAAAMNPAMSSWMALTHRVRFEPGQSVLVMGATGSAGRLAIQVARHFGAGSVVAAARDAAALETLGADATIVLGGTDVERELAARAGNVDVVIDYLWGLPAASAIMPILTGRDDRSRLLTWVQIGAVAGPEISLPSAALRQANIQFLGSGQGSLGAATIVGELPALAAAISDGTFTIDAEPHPLAEVERLWSVASPQRMVFVP